MNLPRLPAIQAPGLRDPSSAPYINSKTLRFNDGATIEMAAEAGEENFFLFGLTAQQVLASRGWYNPHWR